MPKPAILPIHPTDPTSTDTLERRAMRDFSRRLKEISKAYVAGLDRIPVEPVVNTKYVYQLDPTVLAMILGGAGDTADRILLEGGAENVWFFSAYVSNAYLKGTTQEFANIAAQSVAYKASVESVATIVRSQAYQTRIALIAAREYEEMKGLSAAVKTSMGRILTDGVARGYHPRKVAKALVAQVGIEESRANRIARTEITTALRRARWDEHDDAQDKYGIRSMLMHYSALSPTTRIKHAERHAQLYTSDEVRDWYSVDGNAINCKCTQISVLVDEKNKPLVPSIVERAKATEQKMKANGRGPWGKAA